jgi:GTP-binding protein
VLKSVADVGLVGLPNVGKSTLIAAVSKATPKVGDYPFTTLEPHLGVVAVGDRGRFVIADIPGLIPGAHEGKGLGIQFLKHIERTSVLVQMIDVTQIEEAQVTDVSDEDLINGVVSQFKSIDIELAAFSETLAKFPRVVVFSKGDVDVCRRAAEVSKPFFELQKLETYLISSATRSGLDELMAALYELVKKVRAE